MVMLQTGDTLLDLYTIRKRLGKGSTARTYQVMRQSGKADLVLKIPYSRLLRQPRLKKAWLAQAEDWLGLGAHPRVASAYYCQEIEGVPHLFSEYTAGYSLSARIQSGQLYQYEDSVKDLLAIARQCAQGLAYAHKRNVLHRHFKPNNVFLLPGQAIQLKISDFGLAPPMPEQSWPANNEAYPTAIWAYAPPEQLRGLELGIQSDIWSWAAVVAELFSGRCLWTTGDLSADRVLAYQEMQEIPMPPLLLEIIIACLQFLPAHRPASFAEILDILDELDTQPLPWRDEPLSAIPMRREMVFAPAAMTPSELGQVTAAFASEASTVPLPAGAQQRLARAQQALANQDYTQALIELAAARAEPNCYQAEALMRPWQALYLHLPRQKLRDAWQIDSRPLPDGIMSGLVATIPDCFIWMLTEQGLVKCWNPLVGEQVFSAAVAETIQPVSVGAFSRCGRYCIVVYADHQLRLWDSLSQQCLQTFTGHSAAITTVAFSADRHLLLSGSIDQSIRLWDCASGHCLQVYTDARQALLQVAFSADVRHALAVAQDKIAHYWPLLYPRRMQAIVYAKIPIRVALSMNGHRVALAFSNHQVDIYQLAASTCLATLKLESVMTALALDMEGRYVLAGHESGKITIWNVADQRCEQTLTGHLSAIQGLVMALDGRYLLSVDQARMVKYWLLDWKMEAVPAPRWDTVLSIWQQDFLAQHKPYPVFPQQVPPSVTLIHQALSRPGQPYWVATDLQQLGYLLACAGYGRLSQATLEARLQAALRWYPDPVQWLLWLKNSVRQVGQAVQLRWAERHWRALQKHDQSRRLQRQQLILRQRAIRRKHRLPGKIPLVGGAIPPWSSVFLEVGQVILLALLCHDFAHYGILALTDVVSAQSRPQNSVHLPVEPLAMLDPVALKQIENQLAGPLVAQRRELTAMLYAKMAPELIQAEIMQLQATLDTVKAVLPLKVWVSGGGEKQPQIHFTAELRGDDGQFYAIPVNMQQGSKVAIRYEPGFIDRLAKQRNDFLAGKPAQWLWVHPYLLAADGRLWANPKPRKSL